MNRRKAYRKVAKKVKKKYLPFVPTRIVERLVRFTVREYHATIWRTPLIIIADKTEES